MEMEEAPPPLEAPPPAASAEPHYDSLGEALAALHIELPPEQVQQLQRYAQALWSWNERLNLTRHTTWQRFAARDVVDALGFVQQLRPGERVLDVGSGGGAPGALFAILRPDLRVTLSESVGKKAHALQEIVREAGLAAQVHAGRAEELLAQRTFDTLAVRAVAPLEKLLRWFAPLWGSFDRLLVLKGPSWVEERGQARHLGLLRGLHLRKLAAWPLHGTHSESVLLQVSQDAPE